MKYPWIPYEIGCTEDEEKIADDDVSKFVCPRCGKKFLAFVEIIHGDPDQVPKVELLLCTDCEESFDVPNLYLLWLDWNNEHETIH